MKLILNYLLAFTGGVFLAVQAGFNTQLGSVLKQPILAVISTSIASAVFGISLYFYTIPKLGISKMIAVGLCGQLIFSLIAGKYGWLNLPVEPLTTKRLIGALAMLIGIFLINSK